MLNIIWPAFIVISFIFSILTGKTNEINNAIFESASESVNMIILFFGTMCLWNGIMKIIQETTMINKLTKAITPFMKFLFPNMNKEDDEYKEITVNIIANILGLGNAATPLGLKAMQTMQKKNKNKDKVSDEMAMFIVLNTASLQIIPTTVIAIRTSLGSIEPCSIIVPIWCATIAADIAGIAATKILMKWF
jgi:spore maturation protein A